jgi:hypothetical protein
MTAHTKLVQVRLSYDESPAGTQLRHDRGLDGAAVAGQDARRARCREAICGDIVLDS